MIYIHFIVNPISGKGNHNITNTLLSVYFPSSKYKIKVDYTEYKGHAILLARDAVENGPDCIVACGGDGTISEVAAVMVNLEIPLGIVPVGSGNGLASNLRIPKDVGLAVKMIKNRRESFIDVGKVNNQYFFSNMGIGIDAVIIRKYEENNQRSLYGYIKAALWASLNYKPFDTVVILNGRTLEMRPFMLFVSNSNEMGYNMGLTPDAELNDGLLDLVIVPELNFWEKLYLGYCILTNSSTRFNKASRESIRHIDIEHPDKIFLDIQTDGEYHNFRTNKLQVEVIKNGLRVIC